MTRGTALDHNVLMLTACEDCRDTKRRVLPPVWPQRVFVLLDFELSGFLRSKKGTHSPTNLQIFSPLPNHLGCSSSGDLAVRIGGTEHGQFRDAGRL